MNKKSGKISVTTSTAAQDSGFAVNPDLIYNQMVGNLMQATSRALYEEVTFNKNQVTSIDWVTYPILRIADSPARHPRPRAAARPAVARLGRAGHVPDDRRDCERVLRSTGTRIHKAPMTPGRVRATLKAAGHQLDRGRFTASKVGARLPGLDRSRPWRRDAFFDVGSGRC